MPPAVFERPSTWVFQRWLLGLAPKMPCGTFSSLQPLLVGEELRCDEGMLILRTSCARPGVQRFTRNSLGKQVPLSSYSQ